MAVPKLRFKDSEGREFPEWEEKKLCKCCTINPPSPKLPNTFIYIDLESVKQGRLLAKKIVLAKDAPSRAQRKVIVGDVLFQTVRPYQKNNFIVKTPETIPMIASTGYSVLRCNKNNSVYIYHETQTEKFSRNVQDRCTGGAYPAITGKELGEIKIPLPSLPEQQKIADFLTAYDTMIDTQSQRVEAMKNRKKGLLQKIFSQEFRFKDEQGQNYLKWGTKKISDICELLNGRAYSQKELLPLGKYRVLRVGNFFTNGEWYYSNLELSTDKYAEAGDLLYAWAASLGPKIWNEEKVIYHYHIWKVLPKETVSKKFLYFLLEIETGKLGSDMNGSTMRHITKGEMEKREILLPSLPEQQKIADFLTAVDKQIEVEEKRLETMKTIKKGLLQQMFI